METQNSQVSSSLSIKFSGENGPFFSMKLFHVFMTIITIGIYYFWAKAASMRYLYQNTEFCGGKFAFHGTGKEMFWGFIRSIAILALAYVIIIFASLTQSVALMIGAFIVYFAIFMVIIPLAIHGSMKYRLSRTTWNGITMSYTGTTGDMYAICIKGTLLSIVTLGIYSFWFAVDLRKYIFENTKLGDVKLQFDGEGSGYFFEVFVVYLLTLITAGIYGFWFARNLYHYFIDNTRVVHNEFGLKFKSKVTAGAVFKLVVPNLLILIFTLGIAFPIVVLRNIRFLVDNIELTGTFDASLIKQGKLQPAGAVGESLSDSLNVDGLSI
ncbi:MAG: DUF898 family protein [Fibrobacteres bacterium]|nr:DUF898 family protein [Fibrobacterota bacterium]